MLCPNAVSRVFIFYAAAWIADTALPFEVPPGTMDSNEDWGASLHAAPKVTNKVTEPAFDSVMVNAVDLNRIVHRVNHHLARGKGGVGRGQTARIMMKLDIEGAEQYVLPHMLAGYSLCLVDRLFMEFHARQYDAASIQKATAAMGLELGEFDSRDRVMRVMNAMKVAFQDALNAPGNDCRVTLATTDDETYGNCIVYDSFGTVFSSAFCPPSRVTSFLRVVRSCLSNA